MEIREYRRINVQKWYRNRKSTNPYLLQTLKSLKFENLTRQPLPPEKCTKGLKAIRITGLLLY